VAVLAGQVMLEVAEYQKFGVADAVGCMDDKMTLQFAIKHGEKLLAQAAKKFALKNLAG